MKIPENVLHDIDMATDFENDVSNRYNLEQQNQNVTPLIEHLYDDHDDVIAWIDTLGKKYNLVGSNFDVDPKIYQQAKTMLAKSGLSVAEYLRLLINDVAENGLSKSMIKAVKQNKNKNKGND